MGRPITKSKPIIFRVTTDAYTVLERRAEAKGMTVNQYVQLSIEQSCNPPKPSP